MQFLLRSGFCRQVWDTGLIKLPYYKKQMVARDPDNHFYIQYYRLINCFVATPVSVVILIT